LTQEAQFVMLQCENPDCRFRCPSNLSTKSLERCPLCGNGVHPVTPSFTNEKSARTFISKTSPVIEVLLDNLRSTLNVGSIFRSADGAGVAKIHLCGTSPTPEHAKIAKTGLGAEWNLPWEYHRNGLDFVRSIRAVGYSTISFEATSTSTPLFNFGAPSNDRPILLVIGNEVSGIDPEILSESDQVCSIPMAGFKSSLNVAVAFGIAVYTIRGFLSFRD